MGYTEPLRRFIQPEGFTPQVNEIKNTMPSWMPGEDYLINFRKGDPYIKVDEGYARLPGKGYEAIHPEMKGLKPEDYPDIVKLRILGDVAPYSREYQKYVSIIWEMTTCLPRATHNIPRARGETPEPRPRRGSIADRGSLYRYPCLLPAALCTELLPRQAAGSARFSEDGLIFSWAAMKGCAHRAASGG